MKVVYDHYDKFGDRFGHIFYKDKFSHYRLGSSNTDSWASKSPADRAGPSAIAVS